MLILLLFICLVNASDVCIYKDYQISFKTFNTNGKIIIENNYLQDHTKTRNIDRRIKYLFYKFLGENGLHNIRIKILDQNNELVFEKIIIQNKSNLNSFTSSKSEFSNIVCTYQENNRIEQYYFNSLETFINFKVNNTKFGFNHNGNLYLGQKDVTDNLNLNLNTSLIHIDGSLSTNIQMIEEEYYNLTNKNHTILVNAKKNNVNIFLNYKNLKLNNGTKYIVKRIDDCSNYQVIIRSNNNDNITNTSLIDGNLEFNLVKCNETVTLQYFDNNWYIISYFQ